MGLASQSSLPSLWAPQCQLSGKQLPSGRPAEALVSPRHVLWRVALPIAGKCVSRESGPTQTSITGHPQPKVLDVSTEVLFQGRWRVTDT